MEYSNLKQKNPLWANDKIKGTNLLLKNYGCAICSLANLVEYYGYDTDPGQLNTQLKFTPDGLVYWESLTGIYPDIKFIKKYDWSGVSANMKIIDDLLSIRPLIAETRAGLLRKQSHFVVIWEKRDGKYVMSDPLSDSIDFQLKYGEISRWLYKCILYKKTENTKEKNKKEILFAIQKIFKETIKIKELIPTF